MTLFEKIDLNFEYDTSETVFTEKDLLLGILWEGDLEIHSNAMLMKTTPFGERIVHGDSVTGKAISLIFNSSLFAATKSLELQKIKYTFLSPVYIDDRLQVKFIVKDKTSEENSVMLCSVEYCVYKNELEKPISEGKAVFNATL